MKKTEQFRELCNQIAELYEHKNESTTRFTKEEMRRLEEISALTPERYAAMIKERVIDCIRETKLYLPSNTEIDNIEIKSNFRFENFQSYIDCDINIKTTTTT